MVEGKWLVFRLGDRLFGVSIDSAEQIVGLMPYTEVPESRDYVKGVVNLRGVVMPLFDLRIRLGLPEVEYTARSCIIINNINDLQFGFVVDSVEVVSDFDASMVSEPPRVAKSKENEDYLVGIAHIGEQAVLLIDAVKLFSDAPVEALSNLV